MEGYKQGGLKPNKYIIEKSSGEPLDVGAEYFVLRVDVDPHARKALRTYMESVREDNPRFADDIALWLTLL